MNNSQDDAATGNEEHAALTVKASTPEPSNQNGC
jgi:hypothetical protein